MTLTLRLTVYLSSIAFFSLHAQTLEVSPNRVMADESASIRATGLPPNRRLTTRAELVDEAGKPGTDTKFPAQFAGNWLSVPGFSPRDTLPGRGFAPREL